MLKTSTDFEDSIKFLSSSEFNQDCIDNLKYQYKSMDSESHNSNMSIIETAFDNLYEKIRVLEDVINYAKAYVEQNVSSISSQCKDILNDIEEDVDSLKTNSYILYSVPMLEGSGMYTDRDGTVLPHTSINNRILTLAPLDKIEVPYTSVSRDTALTPYKSNINDLKDGKPYRSFYLYDKPLSGGVFEDITISLSNPMNVNFIEILTSNCNIANVQYIHENGTVEYEDGILNAINKDRIIKSFKFTLVSNTYKKTDYEVDAKRMSTNFWDKVKEKEYDTYAGIECLIDISEFSGMKTYQEAYEKYLDDLAAWKAKYS
jgi:hypothetical protein